jgi:hypothetical protein
MKKISLSALGLLFLAGAYSPMNAQTRIGVLAGLSVPNLSGGSNEITQGYVSRLAPHFGITIEHDLSEHFSIQPEIIFDGQGGQRNGLQPITSTSLPPLPSGGYYYADFKNASILNYVEVPVLLRYNFGGKQIRFQVNAGPYFGFLMSATQKTSGTSLIYVDRNRTPLTIPVPPDYTQTIQAPPQSFDASTDVRDSIHRINAGIEGGVGVVVPLSETHALSLEIHGLYGLTNIQQYAEDGTNHTGNLLISLGYSFSIAGIW